jgi:hypothetical protein
LDSWETNGLTVNGQFLDLPALGADPKHQDIFVESDWMAGSGHTQQPTAQAFALIEQAFANAPVSNPDGTTGIRLHVDYGPTAPLTYGGSATWGAESRADAVPWQRYIGTGNFDWSNYNSIKNAHFDAVRRPVFHYFIWANELSAQLEGISGGTRSNGGSGSADTIISLGSWTNGVGSVREQAGTFMHELGHQLGLDHGGATATNYKPNYPSVMNYSFQTRGLIVNGTQGHFDYSSGNLPDLNETRLNEPAGVNGGLSTLFGTIWSPDPSTNPHICYSPILGDGTRWSITMNAAEVDWNCDGDSNDTNLVVDINHDGAFALLHDHDDWRNLVYTGGAIGKPGAEIEEPDAQPVDELTRAENDLIPAADVDAPSISCAAADGTWHADNVTIACTASDPGSGLADPADAAFTLSTSIAAGEETADAQTGLHRVCDGSGNCAVAGPVGGNKVDRKVPSLTLPANMIVNATMPSGASVPFTTTASDGTDPSPVVVCIPATGAVFPAGSTIVSCSATDHAGNHTDGTFSITVKGAAEQIVDLAEKLRTYLQLPALSGSLAANLQATVDALLQKRPQIACTSLRAFITAIDLISVKVLPAAQKADLVADATRIRAVIGCS